MSERTDLFLQEIYNDVGNIFGTLNRIAEVITTTTPKRVRNEAARCGNCPYYDKGGATEGRDACALTNERLVVWPNFWCGQHPDFWNE